MSKKGVIFIDCFSAGLEDLTIKESRSTATVLKVLDQTKRFSVFEATANKTIAATMDRIFKNGLAKNMGGSFPWTDVEITQAGRDLIGETMP